MKSHKGYVSILKIVRFQEEKFARRQVKNIKSIEGCDGRILGSKSSTSERRQSKIGPVKPLYWPDHQIYLLGTSECLIFHVQEF